MRQIIVARAALSSSLLSHLATVSIRGRTTCPKAECRTTAEALKYEHVLIDLDVLLDTALEIE